MNAVVVTQNLSAAQHQLRRYSRRALARLRLQAALHALGAVLTVALWLLSALIFADRLFSLSALGVAVWIPWLGLLALGLPYVLWRVYARRIHENLAAILADERLGLHSRLCTALTVDWRRPENAPFCAAFVAEAAGRLSSLKVERAFPLKLPRTFPCLLLPAALCAGLFFLMPSQDRLGLVAAREQKRKAEAVRERVAKRMDARLEDLKEKLAASGDEKGPQLKASRILQKADDLAKELKDGQRDSEDAVVALGQLKRETEDAKDQLRRGKEFLDRLEKLSGRDLNLEESALTREVSQALKMGDPALAARHLRKLAREVEKNILDNPGKTDAQKKEDLDKLRREVERLAGALADEEAVREGLRELSRKTLSASEFQSLNDEIKKQREKQNQGNRKLGDDVARQMDDVADRLEEAGEENRAALNRGEEDEMERLNQVEEGVDEALQGLCGQDGRECNAQIPGKISGTTGCKSMSQSGAGRRVSNRGRLSASGRPGVQAGQSGEEGGQETRESYRAGEQAAGRDRPGHGQPGPGLGAGPGSGTRPYRDGDAEFEKQKVKGKLRAGAITGLSFFRGQGAKGDAPEQFVEALKSARQDSESSLELEHIPSDARELVKEYYSGINTEK